MAGKITYVCTLGVILGSLLLVACGGGSSGTGAPQPPDAAPAPAPAPQPAPTLKPLPSGIYNSAAIKGRNGNTSLAVTPAINNIDVVSGTLVKVRWSAINPSPGVFDLSIIAEELEAAEELDTDISLIILDSKEMPQFVLDACETFDYAFRGLPEQTCLPWDTEYLNYKEAMVQAVGEMADGRDVLRYVYITYAAMTNGAEMHWRVSEADFTAAGYTPDKLINAYNRVTDMYASAFPTTPLTMEVHTVFNSDALAANTYAHCSEITGERCGVAIWWCASRLATNPSSSEYAVFSLAQQAAEESFAVCQTLGSMTDQPERFSNAPGASSLEVFDAETAFFLGEGFSVFELWTSDIRNDAMQQRLRDDVLPRFP